jgi:hypothetical protein
MKNMKQIILIIVNLTVVSLLSGKMGDTLYVLENVVDLKKEATNSSSTLIQLNRGHKLLEISREGEWVEVGAEKTGGKIGWLRISETSSTIPQGEKKKYKTAEFKVFEKAFWKLSNGIEKQSGLKFFTDAEYMGDGIVKIVATDVWLSAPKDMRQGNLQTIYDMWKASEGSGLPIAVYVYDSNGKIQMKKNK